MDLPYLCGLKEKPRGLPSTAIARHRVGCMMHSLAKGCNSNYCVGGSLAGDMRVKSGTRDHACLLLSAPPRKACHGVEGLEKGLG